MHKHRWAVFAAAIVVAGVAVAAAMAGPSRSTAGKTFYFIPKDTLNPYEVIADRGGKIALTELGDKQVVQSGTEDTAAAQQPAVQAAIQARAGDIRPLLREDVAGRPWFGTEEEVDADYPSGRVVRTEVVDGGCIFLAHDRRGCAIHRASLENGWDFRGVKPAICRLFPLSYEDDTIVIADEYPEYSCAHVEGPTLYRITRDTLAELFGADLVSALDAVEQSVLDAQPRRLPVM